MDITIELGALLAIQLIGSSCFARFESETSPIRKIMKWLILDSITVALYFFIGHYALIFPGAMLIIGTIYHFWWCRKNGIDPIMASPRRKYYQLRGWEWKE